MIMKRIDCWERSLAIRNQEISRNSGIGIDIKGDFLRLISVSLFLTEHFHIPRCSRLRRRHHAFKHFRPCRLLPLLEVLNRTVSPSHRIGQFLLQRFYIGRNLSLPFILLPLLKLRLRRGFANGTEVCASATDACNKAMILYVIILFILLSCFVRNLSSCL